MRLVSFTSLFFILFTLIMVLHGRVIRKRDTSGTVLLTTDDDDQQTPANDLSTPVNNSPIDAYRDRLRRRNFRRFQKK